MAVKHIKTHTGGCWCGEITPAVAEHRDEKAWTADPGDTKASKKCVKARTRGIRHLAMHATAGQPISPALAERLWQPGDDVPRLRERVLQHLAAGQESVP